MSMPDFLVIGAEKAGTTSLYHYLNQHPQIGMGSRRNTGFFAFECETKLDVCGPGDQAALKNRIFHVDDYQALFSEAQGKRVVGEVSTAYIYHPLAAERIRHYIPKAKLIAVLRHPVSRAYSHFLMNRRKGLEPLDDFTLALAEEQNRTDKNWGIVWHYLSKGFYAGQLERYRRQFPGSQLRIFLYEDLCRDAPAFLKEIFYFLGVDGDFNPDVSAKYNTSLETEPPLAKSLHDGLVLRYYKNEILRLEKLLGRDLSAWLP